MIKSIGVVGAGLSALTCSHELLRTGVGRIDIFEKSRGLAGRAATRRENGYAFDHGANYFSLDLLDSIQRRTITDFIGLVDWQHQRKTIAEPIFILNEDNTITESNRQSEKMTFPQGINHLGKLIHESNLHQAKANYQVTNNVLLDSLEQVRLNSGKIAWILKSGDQEQLRTDLVLLCPPGPQTHAIIAKSKFLPEYQDEQAKLLDVLSKSKYHSQISIAYGFSGTFKDTHPFYALVNMDRRNDVSWLSFEHKKPGRLSPDQAMIILQMSPSWSEQNWSETPNDIAFKAFERVKAILEVPQYSFHNIQKWKYALPSEKIDYSAMAQFAPLGLYFTGDTFTDKGRVGLALLSGITTAQDILKHSKL